MTKTYAIADLHGRLDLLDAALQAIASTEPEENYTVVFLGDYVDRGPMSRGIIERLMEGPKGEATWVCLQGNHENIMLQSLADRTKIQWWIENGGNTTLLSYGHSLHGRYTPQIVPQEHVDWLRGLPLFHKDEHRVYVHAGVDSRHSLAGQYRKTLQWKLYDEHDHEGYYTKHVVHGHHQFADGPKLYKSRTNLDTCAWHTGRLVVGVFDDRKAGGPIDFIEVKGLSMQELADTVLAQARAQ